jgi:hypothetical protein
MSIEIVSSRFAKLRSLREKLCNQEDNLQEASEARDWVVEQLHAMKQLLENPATSKEDLLYRVEDLLCVLDPKQNGSEND